MKSIVAFLLCFCLFLPKQVFSSQQVPTLFSFHPENAQFLQYFLVWNRFDSAMVLYRLGEVQISSGGISQRVLLDPMISPPTTLGGANNQGEDLSLRASAHTNHFILPASGEISYFQELAVGKLPCDPDTSHHQKGNEPGSDVRLYLLDKSEFVLQLVRASDDSVITVLDSVGVNAQPSQVSNTFYGNPLLPGLRKRNIPSGYAGQEAYIRISPRRYGPTPYGMELQKIQDWVNSTALWDSTGMIPFTRQQIDTLWEQSFQEYIVYCDSVKTATHWLPQETFPMSDAQLNIYTTRYLEPHTDSLGTYYTEKSVLGKFSGNGTPIPVKETPNVVITEVSPNPANSRTISVAISVRNPMLADIRVFSAIGDNLGSVWSGSLSAGDHAVALILPTLSTGTYFLSVESSGRKVCTYKFQVKQ